MVEPAVGVMEKEQEFLRRFAAALEALPFDLKTVVGAVSEPDLAEGAREVAAGAVIHVINPKDRHFEPSLRHSEDVVLLRMALKRVIDLGGDGAADFQTRRIESFSALDSDLALFRSSLGDDVMDWLEGRFATMKKGVFGKKTVAMYIADDELGIALYDAAVEFATDYPIAEGALADRLKQAQPIVEHLRRKMEQDRMKIGH